MIWRVASLGHRRRVDPTAPNDADGSVASYVVTVECSGCDEPTRLERADLPETFILIPRRTARQGTTLDEGKFTIGTSGQTSSMVVCPDVPKCIGLMAGDTHETGMPTSKCFDVEMEKA